MIPPAEVLAMLDPRTIITVGVPAGALLEAMEKRDRGRLRLSSQEAAAEFGWRVPDWNRWAREDEDAPRFDPNVPRPAMEGTRWSLPREWCERVYRQRMKIDEPAPPASEQRLSDRRGNHGPRKSREQQRGEAGTTPAAPRRLAAL